MTWLLVRAPQLELAFSGCTSSQKNIQISQTLGHPEESLVPAQSVELPLQGAQLAQHSSPCPSQMVHMAQAAQVLLPKSSIRMGRIPGSQEHSRSQQL